MAQPPGRTQEQELLAQIRLNSREVGLLALKRLLEIRLQAADSLLRRCQPAEFPAAQARAAVYEQMLNEFWKLPTV